MGMKTLEGKKAVVTGASKGIGRAIAIKLAQEGADVAVNYNSDREGAVFTCDRIREEGVNSLMVKANLADMSEIETLFKTIRAEWGSIDILVNNAGITLQKPFMEITPEDWQKTIATNLSGMAFCIQHVLKDMLVKKRGKIVNISSIHGTRTAAGFSAYAASKGGIDALTRALAVEYGTSGININSLMVGAVLVDRTSKGYTEERKDIWKKYIPVGRWGTADEIAEAVLFLVSDKSDFIHGTSMAIDGGSHVKLVRAVDFD